MRPRQQQNKGVPFAAPEGGANNFLAIAQEAAANTRKRWLAGLTVCLSYLLSLLCFLLFCAWSKSLSLAMVQVLFFLMLSSFLAFLYALGPYIKISEDEERSLALLSRITDKEAVGSMLDSVSRDRRHMEPALLRCLPLLCASDRHLLTVTQRQQLSGLLNGRNIPLALAVLRALEQVGGADAIPDVRRLAAGQGHAGRNPALRQAARDCLLFLQRQRAAGRISDQLLRTAMPATAPDTLLRPANASQTDAAPNELLRAQ